jgi:hypothetical protein
VADQRHELNDNRLIVAILRLRVSYDGVLLYGEAIDADTERARRFMTWSGLADQVRALISDSISGHADSGYVDSAGDSANSGNARGERKEQG